MQLSQALSNIKDYQNKLGYTFDYENPEDQIQHIRALALAQFQEVAEFVDWTPWKPWREISEQVFDKEEAAFELVDQFFFMANLFFALGYQPADFTAMFVKKLEENIDRINRGYNKQVS